MASDECDELALKAKQKDALQKMLNFNKPIEEIGRSEWKACETLPRCWLTRRFAQALIYDKPCRDIISPVLNKGDLSKQGVTLHKLISDKRDAVAVAAIYFISPTEENIKLIAADVSNRLYDTFHINFSSSVPRPLLEQFAKLTLETDSVRLVSKIFDHCTGFVSMESTCFSLNMPNSYSAMHTRGLKDSMIEAQIESIVTGLFGVIATMGVIPVLRAQPGEAAEMVARKLHKMIQEHLSNRSGMLGDAEHAGFQRPVLVLLDRGVDIPVMLHHPWTYHALAADTLETRLNHVTLEIEQKGRKQMRTYDVDSSDAFWKENAGRVFQEVMQEVDNATMKYKADSEELQKRTGCDPSAMDGVMDGGDQTTKELTAAMSLLPEMQERKRRLDIHTNVATAILQMVKARDLHALHKLEKAVISRAPVEKKDLRACLVENEKATLRDRIRLLLVYYLCTDDVPEAEMAEYEAALAGSSAGNSFGLQYLKSMRAINSMGSSSAASGSAAPADTWGVSKLFMDKVSSTVTNAVKNLIPVGDQIPATRLVEAIMEQRSTPETDGFAYFDPKSRGGQSARVTAPFKDAIVFVVGGGNYSEYQNLQDNIATAASERTVVYGSTELCNADSFLAQLDELGRQQQPAATGAGTGVPDLN